MQQSYPHFESQNKESTREFWTRLWKKMKRFHVCFDGCYYWNSFFVHMMELCECSVALARWNNIISVSRCHLNGEKGCMQCIIHSKQEVNFTRTKSALLTNILEHQRILVHHSHVHTQNKQVSCIWNFPCIASTHYSYEMAAESLRSKTRIVIIESVECSNGKSEQSWHKVKMSKIFKRYSVWKLRILIKWRMEYRQTYYFQSFSCDMLRCMSLFWTILFSSPYFSYSFCMRSNSMLKKMYLNSLAFYSFRALILSSSVTCLCLIAFVNNAFVWMFILTI